jgi:hypothetical protein
MSALGGTDPSCGGPHAKTASLAKVEAAVCAITMAPRDATDASPSVHRTLGASVYGGGVAPSCALPAVRDVNSSSSNGFPICSATDATDWETVGLVCVATAPGVTTAIDRVTPDCTAPTVRAWMCPPPFVPLPPAQPCTHQPWQWTAPTVPLVLLWMPSSSSAEPNRPVTAGLPEWQ